MRYPYGVRFKAVPVSIVSANHSGYLTRLGGPLVACGARRDNPAHQVPLKARFEAFEGKLKRDILAVLCPSKEGLHGSMRTCGPAVRFHAQRPAQEPSHFSPGGPPHAWLGAAEVDRNLVSSQYRSTAKAVDSQLLVCVHWVRVRTDDSDGVHPSIVKLGAGGKESEHGVTSLPVGRPSRLRPDNTCPLSQSAHLGLSPRRHGGNSKTSPTPESTWLSPPSHAADDAAPGAPAEDPSASVDAGDPASSNDPALRKSAAAPEREKGPRGAARVVVLSYGDPLAVVVGQALAALSPVLPRAGLTHSSPRCRSLPERCGEGKVRSQIKWPILPNSSACTPTRNYGPNDGETDRIAERKPNCVPSLDGSVLS